MPVPSLSFVILFVAHPEKSSAFYSSLFKLTPIETSPTFVLFALPNGIMLGLWSRTTAKPSVLAGAGGCEIAFCEDDVDAVYADWEKRGIPMTQEPVDMEGGRAFVALDPDGHRIRVIRLAEAT